MRKRFLGIIFLAVGVVLLYMGYNEYHAVGAKLVRAIGNSPSDKVLALFVIGGISSLVGVVQILKK